MCVVMFGCYKHKRMVIKSVNLQCSLRVVLSAVVLNKKPVMYLKYRLSCTDCNKLHFKISYKYK